VRTLRDEPGLNPSLLACCRQRAFAAGAWRVFTVA
jgi:hypothetical protein